MHGVVAPAVADDDPQTMGVVVPNESGKQIARSHSRHLFGKKAEKEGEF